MSVTIQRRSGLLSPDSQRRTVAAIYNTSLDTLTTWASIPGLGKPSAGSVGQSIVHRYHESRVRGEDYRTPEADTSWSAARADLVASVSKNRARTPQPNLAE